MPKRSWVWEHCSGTEEGYARCNLCDKRYKSNTTTSVLIKHLNNVHGLHKDNNVPEACQVLYDDDNERKKKINEMLVNLIVQDLQPFSIVEDHGFKALLKYLEPRYDLPSRKSIKLLIRNAYIEKKQIVKKELDEASHICITDTWTSINADCFLTVTCHFIQKNFEMKTYILETKKLCGSHTSVALTDALTTIFSEWHIQDKVRAVVTDNAANMLAAIKNIPSVSSVPCFAHTLNLVVKKALNNIPEIEIIRKKSRCIVSYFKASTRANDKLCEMQVALHLPQHKLIIEVDTRWNSTYLMLQRLLEQKDAVIAALSCCNSSIDLLSAAEWEYISECLPILQPFFVLTTEISSELYVTISKVIVSVKQLNMFLNSSSDHILAHNLQEMINKYFNNVEENSLYCIATLLDPRYKLLGFQSHEKAELAQSLILEHVSNSIDNQTTSSNYSSFASTSSNTSLWQSFDKEVQLQNAMNCDAFSPATELSCYLAEKYVDRKSNPLEYWAHNKNKYPHLASFTRKILCYPATSVPSERVFSKAGNILNKKRNRLNDKTLSMILLLNK